MWLAYFKDTGLDIDSGKKPKGQNLEWANHEIQKQSEKKKKLQDLVKKAKGSN